MLESMLWEDNAFITLTYAEENLPERGSLVPRHMQLWLKRLRKMIAPQCVRFYLVGEYGDETERPHYHAALFNFRSCLYGVSRYSKTRVRCCMQCDLVQESWGLGHTYLGSLEERSAQYISGYVLKKMTSVDDIRLNGRAPEFARMSLRPGIGGDSVDAIADSLVRCGALEVDVPGGLRHGRLIKPLGRYLRRRLRVRLGRDVLAPREVQIERSKEMHAMYVSNVLDPSKSVKEMIVEVDDQVVRQLEARRRLFKERKSL